MIHAVEAPVAPPPPRVARSNRKRQPQKKKKEQAGGKKNTHRRPELYRLIGLSSPDPLLGLWNPLSPDPTRPPLWPGSVGVIYVAQEWACPSHKKAPVKLLPARGEENRRGEYKYVSCRPNMRLNPEWHLASGHLCNMAQMWKWKLLLLQLVVVIRLLRYPPTLLFYYFATSVIT